jgi:hypothetical protein
MTRELLDDHRSMLAASAISDDVIAARGYFSATQRSELADLGFATIQRIVPALVVPLWGVNGEIVNYQARPDRPRIDSERGRQIKYETVAGSSIALDVTPTQRQHIGSARRPLWFTEGAKKADALASRDVCAVALTGVWCFRTDDWDRIALDGRRVYIAFDNDVMRKRSVHSALEALAKLVAGYGAIVHFVYLPEDEGKVGVDDFLAAGHTLDELYALAEDELRDLPPEPKTPRAPALPAVTLLDVVERFLKRFVHFNGEHEVTALALYVMHTWAFSSAHATPYLFVKSPQRRSGKTRLLEVLELVCRGAMRAASISEAGLFQAVEAWRPTLLLDEIDAMFTSRSERAEAVRGILNAGNRPNSFVVRGTQDGTPVKFDTFCPKVLAGIDTGKLPDTIRDRSIVIGLERKLRSEPVGRLRERELRESLDDLRGQLENWADEHAETLAVFRLADSITEIDDRLEEAWEPLCAVADVAGGDWPTRARAAAVALSGSDAGAEDHGQLLLAALLAAFDGEAMTTKAICTALNADDELPFGGYRRGDGIDGRGLARLLKPYGIKPQTVRDDDETAKGYKAEDFAEAWKRYADDGERPSQDGVVTDADPYPSQMRHTENGSSKPNLSDCDAVTDVTDEVESTENGAKPATPTTPKPVFDMRRYRELRANGVGPVPMGQWQRTDFWRPPPNGHAHDEGPAVDASHPSHRHTASANGSTKPFPGVTDSNDDASHPSQNGARAES